MIFGDLRVGSNQLNEALSSINIVLKKLELLVVEYKFLHSKLHSALQIYFLCLYANCDPVCGARLANNQTTAVVANGIN